MAWIDIALDVSLSRGDDLEDATVPDVVRVGLSLSLAQPSYLTSSMDPSVSRLHSDETCPHPSDTTFPLFA